MPYKKLTFFLLIFSAIFFSGKVFASQENVDLYLFSAEGCAHCRDEKVFLEKMEDKYENISVYEFEITKSEKNRRIFQETLEKLGTKSNGVPFTVIGDKYFIGFGSEETTGKLIEEAILDEISNGKNGFQDMGKIDLPILGEVDAKKMSLPVLTVIVGGLDGFNPCAMWVLVFLIGLLLGMKDRKRMWIFGSAFIISSSLVYFLFMSAWLNLFLFLGVILWVRLIIAGVAFFSGGYYLRDFYVNKEGECKVEGGGKKKKVFEKLREIIHERNFFLALAGIIMLAFAVNLVELICSAGLPAVYTQVLALSNLPAWQYYAYIFLYVFFFMLDDLAVFVLAMITLKHIGISGKYSRYSRLIGGILMLILGYLLIFHPQWLMFG
ncbi:MAG: hypothetical protein PHH24_01410 [Candidatus Moranbacteria bacterium]|jgi:thiol-disulfide isomerase/thioredoxin|nr:hypothetical protein [Candidatus Moranbacteria bacterium]MDD5651828.1 hypothetical protein [Candidatus Moranbacteria bacterium]MDX9855497.1 hypothetical protein [Candidatus Moranbacteria bacterium]